MPIDRFINERKTAWQRLEELLQRVDTMSLRKLHREEVLPVVKLGNAQVMEVIESL